MSTRIVDLPMDASISSPPPPPPPEQRLPSRDIPKDLPAIVLQADGATVPNYIPAPPTQPTQQQTQTQDQRSLEAMFDDMAVRERNAKRQTMERRRRFADDLLVQLQRPILLALLFFLFQLPSLRMGLVRYVPFLKLCGADGNLSTLGMTVFSMLFGACVFGLDNFVNGLCEQEGVL